MSLTVGSVAPDFEQKDQNGDLVKLSDYKGQKVVLYFYPKDSTPGCTAQACNLNDNLDALKAKGYVVLGVSVDSPKSHKKFIEKYGLGFTLISDEDHSVVEAYGVWVEKSMYGRTYMGTARTTFIIDENGIIQNIIGKVDTKNHTNQVISE
ncbi:MULTISPECIES: thioredoxin-dependent thiol peroxidase [Bacteroidota]|jgi:peroxiredoxin Q/BCP|uniref:thioredoxin-dependent peroxiredoxin n=2 Tax=Flectobacillus TaxID=101 RepID=A0ABT6YWZ6_9BACT|nr:MULTISPECIES: thioredoxin-dependent thiol peroxidase [Bacteroidota]MDI9864547.1 thioredoxin-dependent thiol peroxidase [Flectobacillus longus]MDI9873280.1 thioredoxin-dependent thiol peroxidase [Flectobacillus rivi]MDI9880144.1 thioredoxin-dependent thiol peroxidase [Flectobacillus longus]NBB31305.1 thioredoxin-dependent thiol peroxidase [Cellulophaga sp. BC115SP]